MKATDQRSRGIYKKITAMQCHDIIAKLREVVTVENGAAVYKPGWDDNAVARAVHPDVKTNSVAKIRNENFGLLARASSTEGPGLAKRVADLETMVRVLEAEVAAIRGATNGPLFGKPNGQAAHQ